MSNQTHKVDVVYLLEYSEKMDSEFDPWVSNYFPHKTLESAKASLDTVAEWYETTMTERPNYRCWMGDDGGNTIWRIVEAPVEHGIEQDKDFINGQAVQWVEKDESWNIIYLKQSAESAISELTDNQTLVTRPGKFWIVDNQDLERFMTKLGRGDF